MSWVMDIRQKEGEKYNFTNTSFSLNDVDINNNHIRVFRLIREDESFIGDISLEVSGTCLDENRPRYTTKDIIVATTGAIIGAVIGFMLTKRKTPQP